MITIRRGLNLPISGAPEQKIYPGPKVKSVGLVGLDYLGMKPTMLVAEGDLVKRGSVLFVDKKNPGVKYTAPAAGRVSAIHRGEGRVLLSVVITIEGADSSDEQAAEAAEHFHSYPAENLAALDRHLVVQQLNDAGLWIALRTRPFNKSPALDGTPCAVFITAIDTHPLAADPAVVIARGRDDFINGVQVLSNLTEGKVFICKYSGADIPSPVANNQVVTAEFAGVHPAGLVGTHIHFLQPVSATKTVWTINYQDVMAIGRLFTHGELNCQRVISFAGPQVQMPHLLRTTLGVHLPDLTSHTLNQGDNRVISGSVFGGRKAHGAFAYLGRYHNQVSVLAEGHERPFLHYLRPGADMFSVMRIYLSKLFPNKVFNFTTTTNGSERAMVPVGSYEKVMPLDILPTQLLRALIVGDTETAQQLGCLELDEEDLALCTFVCPGKYEYGPILRDVLTRIEQEG